MAFLRDILIRAREKSDWWKNFFFSVLACLVILNIFIRPHHPHFEAENFPGFWALFGLGCTVLLVKVAKGCAHTFLGKDEDFYEHD
ncbi:MAG: hypothetical protein Q9M37_04225 [Desulfonauticus sp.]|nr:hypothetical protein [Desulfonauticus sp.]